MKYIYIVIFSTLLICIISCKSKNQNFYHGYVYNNENKKPLKNVIVKENLLKNFLSSKTDSTGYFRIQNNTQSIADLIFICENFKKDTVKTIWSQHGENLKYLFLNKIPDTIFLKPNR
jgi:hypothetical protein